MVTKRDKETNFAEREKNDEMSSADQQREEYQERAKREARYEGEVDPASMIVSPHSKPKIESETKIIGSFDGDPRVISPLAVDTQTEGTETPWRDTPPTNVSSTFETNNDHSPPHDPNTDPEDLDSMHEDLVPPEGEVPLARGYQLGQEVPPVETRPAVEVFPPERDKDMEPPRPRPSQNERDEPARRRAER